MEARVFREAALGADPGPLDVQQRNQRPKLDLYSQHAFAVFRPLSSSADGSLTPSELGFRKRGWL